MNCVNNGAEQHARSYFLLTMNAVLQSMICVRQDLKTVAS